MAALFVTMAEVRVVVADSAGHKAFAAMLEAFDSLGETWKDVAAAVLPQVCLVAGEGAVAVEEIYSRLRSIDPVHGEDGSVVEVADDMLCWQVLCVGLVEADQELVPGNRVFVVVVVVVLDCY